MKNKISLNIKCPSCNGDLQPSVLLCHECGIKIEGDFIKNEFNSLSPDELHFLRVFIRCEGRISDMESSLGVSYPTVKGYLANLKRKLAIVESPQDGVDAVHENGPEADNAISILSKLESGEISFKKAVQVLRTQKKGNEK